MDLVNTSILLQDNSSVILRDFTVNDHRLVNDWASNIDSSKYMSRYSPKKEETLLHKIIQTDGNDVGVIWLERGAEADTAMLGIILRDESLFGHGIGTKAIMLTLCKVSQSLSVIRLHVRDDNARAISCYESCGFHILGEGEKITQGRKLQFKIMERRNDINAT